MSVETILETIVHISLSSAQVTGSTQILRQGLYACADNLGMIHSSLASMISALDQTIFAKS